MDIKKICVFLCILILYSKLYATEDHPRSLLSEKTAYYFEYCSVTQFHPKKGMGRIGGKPGHAVAFLKGVCLDKNIFPYKLTLCSPEFLGDPDIGVGISVDNAFRNINFISIPGRKFFFYGSLQPEEEFNLIKKKEVIQNFIDQGLIENIEYHDGFIPENMTLDAKKELMVEHLLGTDFGIGLARNLYCIKIPMIQEVMQDILSMLNEKNIEHQNSKGKDYRGFFLSNKKTDNNYHWHGIFDNCTHLLINVLAKLGIVSEKKTNKPWVKQVFNVAIPANSFIDLQKEVNKKNINPLEYFETPTKRHTFLLYNWLPLQVGNTLEVMKMHQNNTVFTESDYMTLLPHLFKRRHRYFEKITHDRRYLFETDYSHLEFNLKRFTKALERIKKIKESHRYTKIKEAKKEDKDFLDFIHKFENFLKLKTSEIYHALHLENKELQKVSISHQHKKDELIVNSLEHVEKY